MRLSLLLPWLALLLAGCVENLEQTLTIKADGTAVLERNLVLTRKVLEQQVVMMEKHRRSANKPATPPPPADQTPDQAFAAKVQTMVTERSGLFDSDQTEITSTVDAVTLTATTVTVKTTSTFKTLKALVGSEVVWPTWGHYRFVIDDDGKQHLRMRLMPPKRNHFLRYLPRQLAETKIKGSIVVVLPGPILTASTGSQEGSKLTLAFDASNEAGRTQIIERMKADLAVVSETGGLSLTGLPLDSRILSARPSRGEPESPYDQLPLSQATTPWTGQAKTITTRFTWRFPQPASKAPDPDAGAEDDPMEREDSSTQDGTMVAARILAPAGRKLMTLLEATVVKAVDDQGRAIAAVADEMAAMRYRHQSSNDDDNEERRQALDLELQLAPLAADAQAIERLEAQVTVVSFTDWKELRLAEAKPSETVHDLSSVLPGTKLRIIAPKTEGRADGSGHSAAQTMLSLQVTGPKDIQHLTFKVQMAGTDYVWSYATNDRTQKGEGDALQRELELHYSVHSRDPQAAAPTLRIRFPTDLQRNQATIVLEALDVM